MWLIYVSARASQGTHNWQCRGPAGFVSGAASTACCGGLTAVDPTIVACARELTAPALPMIFTVGDAPDGIPPALYDVITCIATIHHLPFSEVLICFRRRLAPGGTLVVVGLARLRSRINT